MRFLAQGAVELSSRTKYMHNKKDWERALGNSLVCGIGTLALKNTNWGVEPEKAEERLLRRKET